MRKKTIITYLMCAGIALMLSMPSANAQVRFSIGLEPALPMGDLADLGGFGFGGSLRAEFGLSDNLSLGGHVGYITFGKEETSIPGFFTLSTQYSMIPIQVDGRYYFNEMQNGFYAGLAAGLHMTMAKTEIEIPGFLSTDETTSDANFSYAPGIGYHLGNIDIYLRYQLISAKTEATVADAFGNIATTESTTTFSYLGFRLAYVFGEAP
jgi:hypothetical protein